MDAQAHGHPRRRGTASAVAYVIWVLSALALGFVLVLPAEPLSSCPPPAEGRNACLLMKLWLPAATKIMLVGMGAHLLSVVPGYLARAARAIAEPGRLASRRARQVMEPPPAWRRSMVAPPTGSPRSAVSRPAVNGPARSTSRAARSTVAAKLETCPTCGIGPRPHSGPTLGPTAGGSGSRTREPSR